MIERIAALIVNYNMPEATDRLVEEILLRVTWPLDILVIDNGSDLVMPSRYTALALEENVQTTAGWLMGLHYADYLARKHDERYFAYWFLITSAEIVQEGDPLSPMALFLHEQPEAIGVHPALTEDSTTAWKHLISRGGQGCRRTWMIDNIASLYRASWLDENGRFDPEMDYAWGIDLETSWKARRDGRGLYVMEPATIRKTSDVGYKMERMNMTAEERRRLAGANMASVLGRKYGPEWNTRMRSEFVAEEWR